MDTDIIDQKVDEALRILGEHCDSVQILLEFTDGKTCYRKFAGDGSIWARQGLAREFLQEQEARIFHHIKKTEFTEE